MTSHTPARTPWRPHWLLGAGTACLMAYLFARAYGHFPAVFADELFYGSFARLLPFSEASLPSYLYFALFRTTNACGTAFLDCARGLNVLLFGAAVPFLYLAARQVAGQRAAMAATLLSLLLPASSYSAYFMPEALYFFAFYVLTWFVLTRAAMHWAAHALCSGLILGAMTLVKVHALFLLPPLCLFIAYLGWTRAQGGPWLARGGAAVAITALAVFVVKFGLGYLLGGEGALHLFGSFYGGQVNASASHPLSSYLLPAWINGRAHLMGLAALFGLPITLALHGMVSGARCGQARGKQFQLYLYTLLMLGATVAMTVMYTASIVDFAPREIERLHLRYYDFIFPLLLLVAAGALRDGAPPRLVPLAWILALAAGLAAAAGALMLPRYVLSMIDGPDIAAVFAPPHALRGLGTVFVLAQLALLALWLLRRRVAIPLFLFVFVPAMLIVQNGSVQFLLAHVAGPSAFDNAGIYVRTHLPPAERKEVVIAGTGLSPLMRAKFHIDEPAVSFVELAQDAPFDMDKLPVRRKWLLVVGPHALPPSMRPAYANGQFALLPIHAAHRKVAAADFATAPGAGLIARLDGVDKIEPWGRWSNARQVQVHFSRPLPKRLNILLKAQSYGPNARQDYILRIGGTEKRFRIANGPEEVFLQLETDGLQDSLSIDIPQPVSPKDIEGSLDTRKLGLGLIGIEVGERP